MFHHMELVFLFATLVSSLVQYHYFTSFSGFNNVKKDPKKNLKNKKRSAVKEYYLLLAAVVLPLNRAQILESIQ
jgi:hypothetical protein